jgi:CubicO group peptidase (beta-lactamase class C family)
MNKKILIFTFVLILCLFGFSREEPYIGFPGEEPFNGTLRYDQPYHHVPYDWPTSTPEEQGLDPHILAFAFDKAVRIPHVFSLLVIRNDYLVAERYFNGQNRNRANQIASVGKSFTSALTGLALRDGHLGSLDEKVLSYFPEYVTGGLDPRKHDITIRHLLQMRAGYPYDSTDDYFRQRNQSGNWLRFIIVDHPLVTDPGTRFEYSNASAHLLSGVLTKATGMPLSEYASRALSAPSGIRIAAWGTDPQGYHNGAGDHYVTPRDLARFGSLYLNRGVLDGHQILPGYWVEESLEDHSEAFYSYLEPYGHFECGYMNWRHRRAHGHDVYSTGGHGGQYIVIVPELKMIVVSTAYAFPLDFTQESWRTEGGLFFLIFDDVLPAAVGVSVPPPYPPSGICATRVENRSLLLTENIDILEWQQNPLNSNENISKYRIYYYTDESGTMTKVLLVEVNAGTTEYWCRNAPGDNHRTYGIASVTYDNRESLPAAIIVR